MRAKTPLQKKEIITRLYKLWRENPELRFSQLIENVYHHLDDNHCMFHIEDYPFVESLEKHYGKIEGKMMN